jgi:hypothetical protein
VFALQEGHPQEWKRIVDTSLDYPEDIVEPDNAISGAAQRYTVAPRFRRRISMRYIKHQ